MMRSLSAAVVFLVFLAAIPAYAISVTGLGFSFELPDDWRAIQRSDIEQKLEGGRGSGRNPALLMAYEPEEHQRPFSYPYVTVRSVENEDKGSFETLTEPEIKTRLAKLAGLPEERFEKQTSTEPATRPDRVPRYSVSPPSYVMDSWDHIGEYDIHTRRMAFLGKTYGVIVTFAAKDADFAEQSSIADNIISTFRFAPSQAAIVTPSFWEMHGTQTVMGLIILGLACFFGFYLIRWFTRETERPM